MESLWYGKDTNVVWPSNYDRNPSFYKGYSWDECEFLSFAWNAPDYRRGVICQPARRHNRKLANKPMRQWSYATR